MGDGLAVVQRVDRETLCDALGCGTRAEWIIVGGADALAAFALGQVPGRWSTACAEHLADLLAETVDRG